MVLNKKIFMLIIGFFSGIISSLLGAGGGLIMVPALRKAGLKQQYAHAASVCIMLPICIIGAIMYIKSGVTPITQAIPYIPAGIIGAVVGSLLLSKINSDILGKIFGGFSIWAALRLLMR